MSVLLVSALGWLLIKTAQSLKYSIIPFFVTFARSPKAVVKQSIENLMQNPRETLRDSWNEL
ncbi:hypothetical protein GCM10009000_077320 [Halobacterium noricense]|uniref:Uncharacterized protein n=1 Tax=Haladaptatus pallidirubidus TaxID=1008152 RepID=A0AAV3UPK9_9EURY